MRVDSISLGAAILLVCALPGCALAIGIDGLVADRDDVPGIVIPTAGGSFTIDAYEVTMDEYAAWLATDPTTGGQRDDCAWNDSFVPGAISPAAFDAAAAGGITIDTAECDHWVDREAAVIGHGKLPIACVDWCDAIAYCASANEHLCGAIGGGVLDVTPPHDARLTDPESSEWYRACTHAGAHAYPYGDSYQPATCNDEMSALSAVDAYPQCEGGYQGIFGMSGNAAEWSDECTLYNNPPAAQNCMRRGGSWFNVAGELACGIKDDVLRSVPSSSIGFRCCR